MKKYFTKKNILVINHSSVFGGATQSLLIYIQNNLNYFNFTCITPKGSSSRIFNENNIKTFTAKGFCQFNNNNFGFYQGWRWFIILREIFLFIYNFFYFAKLRFYKKKFDLIILNDLTLLPLTFILKFFFRCKVISYVRSKQNKFNKLRSSFQEYLINKNIDKLIYIDKDVKSTVSNKIIAKAEILYNSFYLPKKKPKYKKKKQLNIGFVGNFTNSKGIEILIAVIKKLRYQKNIFFYIVGPIPQKPNLFETILKLTGIRENYYYLLKENEKKICKNSKFLGFSYKLDNFYNNINLLIFPSYVSAAGRPILEAGLYGIPSLITLFKKDKNDIIKNNYNGLYVKNNSVNDLLKKILYLKKNPNFLEKISNNALNYSKEKFDINKNKKKFRKILNDTIHI